MTEAKPTTDDVDALRTTLEHMLAYLSQQQERSARAPAATIGDPERLEAENAALRKFVQCFCAEAAPRLPHFTGLAQLQIDLKKLGSGL